MDDPVIKEQIAEQGYGKTGDVGGQPKITYWTPDGRMIRAMSDIHEYRRGNGNNVETGQRDANLDKGWLMAKPETLQLYCPHCDRWHPTQEEIKRCGNKKRGFETRWEKKAGKEVGKDDRVGKLESEMTDIKGMLKELLGRK